MSKHWLTRLLIPLILFFGSRVLQDRVANDQLTTPQTNAPLSTPSPQPLTIRQSFNHPPTEMIEQEIHKQINNYRQSRGLSPLKEDYRITDESRKYSAKMASGVADFSHNGFDQRADNLEKKALKYFSVGENLALLQGYEDLATEAVQGWIDSPGHHENIIGDYDLTGIGVIKNEEGVYYFTQLFLKRQ